MQGVMCNERERDGCYMPMKENTDGQGKLL